MSTFTPDPNILNPSLFDTSNVQVQFYQKRLKWPWRRGDVHALGWVFLVIGLVLIYAVLNLRDARVDARRLQITIQNRRNRNTGEPRIKLPDRSTLDRISTHLRSFAYLRWRRTASISIGMCALILVCYLFPLVYVFAQRPYYAMFPEFGPPPISGRAGMIAVAMVPFVIALGMKVNPVGMLTGVGHEKLNVLHRWAGILIFILTLVHAIPYVVEPLVEGGAETLRQKWTRSGSITYWNGVGAFGCLLWLTVASLSPLRRLYYEFFVHSHIVTGVLFVGLLFWHCADKLTSWHYLYATVGIWFFSLLYRTFFRTNLLRCPRGELASLIPVSDSGVKVIIPTTMRWTAGQHVFIRIPAIAPLDNHPFTVASVADPDKEVNDLILVFKPQSGFTRRLHSLATLDPERTYAAFLDGPYGGLSRKLESFETVLLIAGGSGITPIIGHLHHLAHKIRRKEAVTRDIRIIWTVKHFYAFEWFKDEISVISRGLPRNSLLVQYFVTQETPVVLPAGPVSATLQWPGTPMTPLTPIAPAQPLRGSVVIGEEEYLRMLRQMQSALNHEERRRASSSIKSKDIELQPVDAKERVTGFLEPPRPSFPHALTTDEPSRDWKYPPPASDDVSPVSPVSEEGAFPSARRTSTRKGPPSAMKSSSKTGAIAMGDEVHLEFGRPPLRHGLRTWAEAFGKRACIYVCGPAGMKVDVANAVAEMQDDIWMSDDREEVFLHTESFGW